MADTVLAALVVMYAVVAIKVDQWYTISRLGFKSETPQLFLQSPRLYHMMRMALFACAIAASFFATIISWYIVLVVLAATWHGAFWLGRKFAFNTYRQIHREMIAYEEAIKVTDPAEYARLVEGEDPEARRSKLERGTRITDAELVERVEKSLKWGA
ncbi:MAG: hypothetical protein Q7T21_08225 [Gallionella sp.]|nr:hypothetical protein [Gallionella sp.]